ncbi:tRNA pseudouridine32 synthase / 23S rRNA pseudouridine746 synthase [Lutibacter sp. Hel_I_33_5]|uniref:pseudouridine synthase n=1 Tax=Lutibacter sp. Hel_I_33_5 TaxID=1566289 RepID=UPI0011AAC867|nr:pseudouridine synthase [Lutibacter sp. Hel_I_33_5]TVZ56125.1 tRNA pseudouridine32 synthase / 23S rRNA pseudouridine746 synthase [Lutibacter sp. Hel_I_33_5]
MNINKQEIIENICYTELVYSRINKKLNIKLTKEKIEIFILKILKETDEIFFSKTGKNFYVINSENHIRITINSNTFRIITVDEIKKTNHFHHFKEDISRIQLPEKFTFPFYYQPHLLTKIATNEIQDYLENQTDFNHNFGLNSNTEELPIGKMFGVLVVQNQQDEIGYLAAFSGKLANKSITSFFVPPIFNAHSKHSFYAKGKIELNELSKQIASLEKNPHFKNLLKKKNALSLFIDNDLKLQREKMKVARKDRKSRRKKAFKILSSDEFTIFNKKLEQESYNNQFLYKELTIYRELQLSKEKKELDIYTSKISSLKKERKQKSNLLQQKLLEKYKFLNQHNEVKSLTTIFPNHKEQKPPAGTGDCAAPKLLQYAFLNDLKPISMAEFWWGISPNTEIRKHKNFYPACQGRCKPILTHMLSDIEMDENPLIKNTSSNKKLEVIFEDDALIVVNKPTELLSVPGKEINDSVYTRIRKQFPKATGPLIVHRLDMSTSGIIVLTKTKEVNKKLQKQFLERTVKKQYIALLDGNIEGNEGEINLPLRVDLNDRPRQLVCFEHGKPAKTKWKVVDRFDNKTRIHLFPITGRTHQLRVHVSHSLGLNMPIIGDDLYGKKANRLHLHATHIEFEHPISKKRIHFTIPSNF